MFLARKGSKLLERDEAATDRVWEILLKCGPNENSPGLAEMHQARLQVPPFGQGAARRQERIADIGEVTGRLLLTDALRTEAMDALATRLNDEPGLVRLPVKDRDILIFSNIESPSGRHHGTVWASFNGGKTWPLKRLVTAGSFAYSSLDAGRPGTKSEGWIYLLSEGSGGNVARFNPGWVLQGEKTGDGEAPKRLAE